ncbi:hypothetical protein, partial [Xanthomonas fragariae]
AALDRVFACLDAGDGMVILECRAAVTDGTWRLTGIFQGRLIRTKFVKFTFRRNLNFFLQNHRQMNHRTIDR